MYTMESDKEYTISLNFSSFESMLQHLQEYADILAKSRATTTQPQPQPQPQNQNDDDDNASTAAVSRCRRPKEKRENEKRGAHTKEKHAVAREYHANHPEMSYRECYKVVCAGGVEVTKL